MATISSSSTSTSAAGDQPSQPLALGAMMVTFFMCGFITCLNDILIPHLKAVFDLGYAGAMLVQFMFFGAYFVMGLPSGKIINWVGYKMSIVIALLTSGVGALLFWPAAALPSYPLFLFAFFVLAAGLAMF
jgi:MFS transporter, FHS family, L-fucose permease